MLGKPSDPEHQRRRFGFRALTITGRGVTGSVATTAADGTRPRNCRRIWRTSSSATGSQPANLMSPRISGQGSSSPIQPEEPVRRILRSLP